MSGTPLRIALAAALALLVVGGEVSAQSKGRYALVGGHVLMPDGSLASDQIVLVKDGRIEGVTGEGDVPASIRRVTLAEGSVIAPGLTAVISEIGARGQTLALARTVDPLARARDALDPASPDHARALASGYTAAMVCPSPANIVSGQSVTFRTHVADDTLDVLAEGPLVFSLGGQVMRRDREPTSRSGAATILAAALDEAKSAKPKSALAPIRRFLDGQLSGILFASEEPDVRVAMRQFGETNRIPHLVYTPENRDARQTERLAQGLAAAKITVVMGLFTSRSDAASLRAPGIFADAGVPIAFASGAPGAGMNSARMAAALSVRHGLDPAAARRALTVNAATVAGVADRVGSIARGRDADLVIFSGDPLRPDSRVRAVYVRGELAVSHDDEKGVHE